MGFNSGFKGLKVSNDLTIAMVFAVTDRGKYHRNAQRRKQGPWARLETGTPEFKSRILSPQKCA